MKKLELPRTLQFAEPEDAPKNESIQKRIEERKSAEFAEGYTLKEIDSSSRTNFSFYSEININNSKLWNIFHQLSELLPKLCSCLFKYSDDDEPYFGSYMERTSIMDTLEEFKKELIEDCFLEFGLIYNTDTELTEIYIPNSKYVQVWGNDKASFVRILEKNGIKQMEHLNFVDEFPKVGTALTYLDPQAKGTTEFIDALKVKFIGEKK